MCDNSTTSDSRDEVKFGLSIMQEPVTPLSICTVTNCTDHLYVTGLLPSLLLKHSFPKTGIQTKIVL